MNAQVNWKKIRTELQRLADVDKLKTEVTRIGNEIRNFDYSQIAGARRFFTQRKFCGFIGRYVLNLNWPRLPDDLVCRGS